jgi:hypothetical protein
LYEGCDILGAALQYTADVEMAVKLAKRLLTNSRVNLQKGDENP